MNSFKCGSVDSRINRGNNYTPSKKDDGLLPEQTEIV